MAKLQFDVRLPEVPNVPQIQGAKLSMDITGEEFWSLDLPRSLLGGDDISSQGPMEGEEDAEVTATLSYVNGDGIEGESTSLTFQLTTIPPKPGELRVFNIRPL